MTQQKETTSEEKSGISPTLEIRPPSRLAGIFFWVCNVEGYSLASAIRMETVILKKSELLSCVQVSKKKKPRYYLHFKRHFFEIAVIDEVPLEIKDSVTDAVSGMPASMPPRSELLTYLKDFSVGTYFWLTAIVLHLFYQVLLHQSSGWVSELTPPKRASLEDFCGSRCSGYISSSISLLYVALFFSLALVYPLVHRVLFPRPDRYFVLRKLQNAELLLLPILAVITGTWIFFSSILPNWAQLSTAVESFHLYLKL